MKHCSPLAWAFKDTARAIYLIHTLRSPVVWEIKATRMFPQENINISLWPHGKDADHIQLDSKYTSKGNSWSQDSYTMIVKAATGLKA